MSVPKAIKNNLVTIGNPGSTDEEKNSALKELNTNFIQLGLEYSEGGIKYERLLDILNTKIDSGGILNGQPLNGHTLLYVAAQLPKPESKWQVEALPGLLTVLKSPPPEHCKSTLNLLEKCVQEGEYKSGTHKDLTSTLHAVGKQVHEQEHDHKSHPVRKVLAAVAVLVSAATGVGLIMSAGLGILGYLWSKSEKNGERHAVDDPGVGKDNLCVAGGTHALVASSLSNAGPPSGKLIEYGSDWDHGIPKNPHTEPAPTPQAGKAHHEHHHQHHQHHQHQQHDNSSDNNPSHSHRPGLQH